MVHRSRASALSGRISGPHISPIESERHRHRNNINHNLLWYPFPVHNSGSFEWTFLVSYSFARKLILGLCMVHSVKRTLMCAKMSCPLWSAFTPIVAPDLGPFPQLLSEIKYIMMYYTHHSLPPIILWCSVSPAWKCVSQAHLGLCCWPEST